jgi:hypothetical protein
MVLFIHRQHALLFLSLSALCTAAAAAAAAAADIQQLLPSCTSLLLLLLLPTTYTYACTLFGNWLQCSILRENTYCFQAAKQT